MVRYGMVLLLMGSMCVHLWAAPGGSAKREKEPSNNVEARKHYRAGLRHRDAAWVYEEKLSGTTDAKDRAAYVQFIQRTYQRAAGEFEKATELDPKFYQAFSSLGYVLRKTDKMEGALTAYNHALSLNPNYAEAIEYRAEAYLELGRVADAQRAFDVLSPMKPVYADRLLTFAEQWAQSEAKPNVRGDLLKWVAEKRAVLGEVKETVEKW